MLNEIVICAILLSFTVILIAIKHKEIRRYHIPALGLALGSLLLNGKDAYFLVLLSVILFLPKASRRTVMSFAFGVFLPAALYLLLDWPVAKVISILTLAAQLPVYSWIIEERSALLQVVIPAIGSCLLLKELSAGLLPKFLPWIGMLTIAVAMACYPKCGRGKELLTYSTLGGMASVYMTFLITGSTELAASLLLCYTGFKTLGWISEGEDTSMGPALAVSLLGISGIPPLPAFFVYHELFMSGAYSSPLKTAILISVVLNSLVFLGASLRLINRQLANIHRTDCRTVCVVSLTLGILFAGITFLGVGL